jgi:hypothetical protein
LPLFMGLTVNVTTVPEQIVVADGAIVREASMIGATRSTMEFEVADGFVVHLALPVIIHSTRSPSTRLLVVKKGLLEPVLLPFVSHWYDGDAPPLIGEAENVTGEPVQTAWSATVIVNAGVTMGSTFMIRSLDAVVGAVTQVALLVNRQLTTSPLDRVFILNRALFVPVGFPLTCHW